MDISLRDYFAGIALSTLGDELKGYRRLFNEGGRMVINDDGFLGEHVEPDYEEIARKAYRIADAMLKAREGNET